LIACLSVPQYGIRERLRPADVLVWGASGALTSLAFYCIEYFPAVWSSRLEVNHPLWAFAWLGGAAFLATFVGPRGQDCGAMRPGQLLATRLAAGLVAVLPVVLVGLLRERVFIPIEPFVYQLHVEAVKEYEPLFTHYGKFDDTWAAVGFFLPHVCAAVLTGCWLLIGGKGRGRIAMTALFFATTAIVVQGCCRGNAGGRAERSAGFRPDADASGDRACAGPRNNAAAAGSIHRSKQRD
jgi:hypothetical protein